MRISEYPNEITMIPEFYRRMINTGEYHFRVIEGKKNAQDINLNGKNIKYKFNDIFEVLCDTFYPNTDIHKCVSLKYGEFFYNKINETILISGKLCTLLKIKKDNPSYHFVGDKPFLKI